MILYAFQDKTGRWHGDPDTETLDGQPGTGILTYQPTAGGSAYFAGQRLRVLYGPCHLEASVEEVQLDDGVRAFLSWHVLELLDQGLQSPAARTTPRAGNPASRALPQPTSTGRRGRRNWTEEEDELCRTMAAAGHPPDAIAARLGRAVPGVRFHLSRLRLAEFPADLLPAPDPNRPPKPAPDPNSYRAQMQRLHPRAYQAWEPEEDEIAIRLVGEGLSPEEIADALQRQPSAVHGRLEKLGVHPDFDAPSPPPIWQTEAS